MCSRGPCKMYTKFNYLCIKNQVKNELHRAIGPIISKLIYELRVSWRVRSRRLDEIYTDLFHYKSVPEWPPEAQVRFTWNLLISQLTINQRMSSRGLNQIYFKSDDLISFNLESMKEWAVEAWIRFGFGEFSVENHLKNELRRHGSDLY